MPPNYDLIFDGNAVEPVVTRGWNVAEADYDLAAQQVNVQSTPPDEDSVEDEDVIWDESSGADGYYDAQVQVSRQCELESLTPGIGTIDAESGYVTRVSDGTCHIIAREPRLYKRVSVELLAYTSQTTRTFNDWVAGTLGEHISDFVDAGIAAADPNVDKLSIPLSFFTTPPADLQWMRNPECWAAALDLTSIVIWQDREDHFPQAGYRYGGCLVGNDLLIMNNHAHYTAGDKVYWVNNDNETIERTIIDYRQVGTIDTGLCRLNTPITGGDGIDIAKIITDDQLHAYCPQMVSGGQNVISNTFRIPVMWMDQQKKVLLSEWWTYNTTTAPGFPFQYMKPSTSPRSLWWEGGVGGDSGHPVGFPINGKFVFINVNACCTVWNTAHIAEFNAAAAAMGSDQTLQAPDLSAFIDY